MIVNALAQGKTVLFVAEKMAALSVVQKRLEEIGVGDFCLELHSSKSRKKDVLGQLQKVSELTRDQAPAAWQKQAEESHALRAELDAYAEALHAAQPCGRPAFLLIGDYEANAQWPDLVCLDARWAASLSADDLARLEVDVASLGNHFFLEAAVIEEALTLSTFCVRKSDAESPVV